MTTDRATKTPATAPAATAPDSLGDVRTVWDPTTDTKATGPELRRTTNGRVTVLADSGPVTGWPQAAPVEPVTAPDPAPLPPTEHGEPHAAPTLPVWIAPAAYTAAAGAGIGAAGYGAAAAIESAAAHADTLLILLALVVGIPAALLVLRLLVGRRRGVTVHQSQTVHISR